MISALKHNLVFRNITATSKQFLTFFIIFTNVVFYLEFLLAAWFKNKMFTIIRNGSLKWFPELVP